MCLSLCFTNRQFRSALTVRMKDAKSEFPACCALFPPCENGFNMAPFIRCIDWCAYSRRCPRDYPWRVLCGDSRRIRVRTEKCHIGRWWWAKDDQIMKLVTKGGRPTGRRWWSRKGEWNYSVKMFIAVWRRGDHLPMIWQCAGLASSSGREWCARLANGFNRFWS